MFRICKIAITFLKKSKMLTFSAFLSIFFACFLGVSMLQLVNSAQISYKNNILEEYGDYDIGLTKEQGVAFTEEENEQIQTVEDVQKISYGYYVADLDGIYTVGVKDDHMNKSRYKYTYNVTDNDMVINKYLSEKYEKKAGDTFVIGKHEYIIKEVIENDSFSKSKIALAIVDMGQLQKSLGVDNNPNYMLLKCPKQADLDYVTDKLTAIAQGKFQVICVSQDEDFQKVLLIFAGLLLALFIIVVIICGMFILSIFHEYMRKYQCDMAIIRTIGGKRWQVNCIFVSMSCMLSAAGCVLGVVACTLVDGLFLNKLNGILHLFDGDVILNWKSMLLMAGMLFVIYNFISVLFFLIKQRVLPIQVFQSNTKGRRRKKRANRFLFIRKIFGSDGYLAIKFLMPKFWQNFMIVIIIALITALAYTGQASITLLNENSLQYYRDLLNGSDAGVVFYSENRLAMDKIQNMQKEIQETTEQCSYLLGSYSGYGQSLNEDIWSFYVADLKSLMKQFSGEQMEDYEAVPEEQRAVMTRQTAQYSGYALGEHITLNTKWLGGKKEFTIVEIVDWNDNLAQEDGIILEQKALTGVDKDADCPYEAYFYTKGYTKETKVVFEKYETSETGFKWFSMKELAEESDNVSNQRLTMISVVLFVLLIVAGVGWLNSAKSMLVARRQEYQVLRMLGSSVKRVRRMCWIQVWSYMFAGIILGMAIGLVTVYMLWRSNVNANVSISIYWQNLLGIVMYLFMLSICLKTTIKQLTI